MRGGGGVKQELKGSLQVTIVHMLHGWHISRVGRGVVRAGVQNRLTNLNLPKHPRDEYYWQRPMANILCKKVQHLH